MNHDKSDEIDLIRVLEQCISDGEYSIAQQALTNTRDTFSRNAEYQKKLDMARAENQTFGQFLDGKAGGDMKKYFRLTEMEKEEANQPGGIDPQHFNDRRTASTGHDTGTIKREGKK